MEQKKRGIITLLTDFGDSDGYVGSMKGVIMGLCPDARVVDISHRISPYHILSAAFVLKTYCRFFPPRTVHVVVVDPGVGGDRKCIAVRAGGYSKKMAHWTRPARSSVETQPLRAGEFIGKAAFCWWIVPRFLAIRRPIPGAA